MARSQENKSVGLKEVAMLAKVSPTTVSRVLNNSSIPSERTRQAVLKAAAELKYRPDPILSEAARRRRIGASSHRQQTHTVGLLVSHNFYRRAEAREGHYNEVLDGLHDVLDEAGYELMLSRADQFEDRLPANVTQRRLDGVLVWAQFTPQTASYLGGLLPTVFCDRTFAGVRADSVLNDLDQNTRLQLQCLWDHGHRHLVMLEQEAPASLQRLRRFAALTFFEEHPMPPQVAALNRLWPFSPSTNTQVFDRFIAELLAAQPRPTAVLLSQSELGALFVERLRAAGLVVPRDISVRTSQDSIHNTYCKPPLSSFSTPAREIGRAAGELLLKRIKQPDRPAVELRLLGRLIERESVAPPPDLSS